MYPHTFRVIKLETLICILNFQKYFLTNHNTASHLANYPLNFIFFFDKMSNIMISWWNSQLNLLIGHWRDYTVIYSTWRATWSCFLSQRHRLRNKSTNPWSPKKVIVPSSHVDTAALTSTTCFQEGFKQTSWKAAEILLLLPQSFSSCQPQQPLCHFLVIYS